MIYYMMECPLLNNRLSSPIEKRTEILPTVLLKSGQRSFYYKPFLKYYEYGVCLVVLRFRPSLSSSFHHNFKIRINIDNTVLISGQRSFYDKRFLRYEHSVFLAVSSFAFWTVFFKFSSSDIQNTNKHR